MGWESRGGNGRYYTRSRKVGGRVVREYVGAGLLGEFAAQQDGERRAEREAAAGAWRQERARLEVLDGPVSELSQACDQLTRAALLAAGYRQHGGEWRRRRGPRRPGESTG